MEQARYERNHIIPVPVNPYLDAMRRKKRLQRPISAHARRLEGIYLPRRAARLTQRRSKQDRESCTLAVPDREDM